MNRSEFYENFKLAMAGQFPDYPNIEVKIRHVESVNKPSYTGLEISQHKEGLKCSPVFNMDLLYEEYKQGRTWGDIVNSCTNQYHQALAQAHEMEKSAMTITDFSLIRSKIISQVRNVEANADVLTKVPYRLVQEDIAMVYKIVIKEDHNGGATAMIDNGLLEHWGISESELHDVAIANSMRDYPLNIESMSEICGIYDENAPINLVVHDSSRSQLVGAATLFYPGSLEMIASSVGSGFTVIPSSTQEFLIFDENAPLSVAEINEMVKAVNQTLDAGMVLSEHAYHYDPEAKVLETSAKWKQRTQGGRDER